MKINHFYHLLFLVLTSILVGCQPQKPTSEEQNGSLTSSDSLADQSEEVVENESFLDEFLKDITPNTQFVADLDEIRKRDTLRALTIYSSTSYFLYRGEPMGYEYEMARRLADHLGVELEMIVAHNINEIIPMLNEGIGDIITYNFTVTSSRREMVDFTYPLNFTHQVLVQRKPDNWRKMKIHEIERELVRSPIELLDVEVFVRENTSYRERLENLQEELGGEIKISYLPGNLSTDEIMKMVSEDEIDFTVADYNIANINASYHQNLDIETTVGVMQQLAWAVRKTSPELKKVVNSWLQKERKKSEFYVIYNKYFKNSRDFTTRVKSDFYSRESNKISQYDALFRETATTINWDWRFLASMVYQESRFDPKEKSWVGAVGLMQLMPKTGNSYGYYKLTRPKSSMKAGAAHIRYLNKFWKEDIPDSTERVKFILASYNAGQYHVQDARRLATKKGWDPNLWYDNVEKAMLLKSQKKYFTDPVVKYGYCRGEEPVAYVKEIFERYNYYSEFIQERNPKYLSSM